MSKIAIVYWSGTGNTENMANLISEGVVSGGAKAALFTAAVFSAELAKTYDVIAFGCPSMGEEQLEESEFEPMFSSVKPQLAGKAIALFGSYDWGDGEWMRSWVADCKACGCVISEEAVIANGAPNGDSAEACRALGTALAKA